MPRLTLAAITNADRPGNYVDPDVEGLRYRVHSNGRTYAELRYKGPKGWTAKNLGRVNVTDIMAGILDAADPREPLPTVALSDVLEPVRVAARALRKEIRQGGSPGTADTLGGAVERYLSHIRRTKSLRPATLRELDRYLLKDWAPLHPRPIAVVTRGEVQALLDEMAARHGVAANRARTALSGLFQWAFTRDLVTANPVAGTEPVGERTRDRVLSLAELRAIWAATEAPGVPATFGAILKLLMLLGQRRDEVGGLKWEELDLERAVWSIPGARTKNKRPHVVPLPEAAIAVLRGLERRTEHVFGEWRGYTNWSQSKRRLEKVLALPAWTLHDLRRSCVTHMAEMGIEPHHIEAVVNHVSGSKGGVAGIYNRATYAEAKARALRAWSEHLLGQEPAQVVPIRRA